MPPKKETAPYTKNELVSLMHRNTARSLRDIANYIEKYQRTTEYIILLLRESADELDAQAMVVQLRDLL